MSHTIRNQRGNLRSAQQRKRYRDRRRQKRRRKRFETLTMEDER